jgi:uncharacterized sulfatase
MKRKNFKLIRISLFMTFCLLSICHSWSQTKLSKRPNILFCISDDQSYAHTSFNGAKVLKTPGFDRVADNGIFFENAYCNASSCSPSRASILTGKNIWELEEGGLLLGGLNKKFITFSQLLEQNGYNTGYTGKGYSPANLSDEPYHKQPLAPAYDRCTMESPEAISNIDYSANFKMFLDERDETKPFFFWYGGSEPHRGYKNGIGAESGMDISKIEVPGFLPNNELVRNDIADYFYEIQWFDNHLGKMIKALEAIGELENTIIIVTADNGMPFPRAKATCYDYGTHMPLAISWGDKIKKPVKVNDFISFIDFAPTILDVAGIKIPETITGNSFSNILLANKKGRVDTKRDKVFTALERHTYCRPGGMPYPIRTIRKDEWLYIINFEPDRWPTGDSDFYSPHQGYYGDIDVGPTRDYLIANKNNTQVSYFYNLTVSKHPKEELYNIKKDPFQLKNLAEIEKYASISQTLKAELFNYLSQTNDPRMKGLSPWDNYPYHFNGYEKKHLKPINERDSD